MNPSDPNACLLKARQVQLRTGPARTLSLSQGKLLGMRQAFVKSHSDFDFLYPLP